VQHREQTTPAVAFGHSFPSLTKEGIFDAASFSTTPKWATIYFSEVNMGQATVPVVERIMNANNRLASENRAQLDAAGVFGINLMASPGAGKTSLILRTIEALSSKVRMGVLEGDTTAVILDSEKIMDAGVPVVQINTAGSCHLDATVFAS
jgi:hypothetical protein